MNADHDITFMNEAVALARQALGRTAPNPSVGAVVVKDGNVVGRGFTPRGRHAACRGLRPQEAGEKARGADIYVTLEPCNHYGRTPLHGGDHTCRCSQGRGGHPRPNPLVAGKGIVR